MITVSVTYGEMCCDIAFETDAYSGEVVEDLVKRAAATVLGMAEVERESA